LLAVTMSNCSCTTLPEHAFLAPLGNVASMRMPGGFWPRTCEVLVRGCERGSDGWQLPKRVSGVSELAVEHLRVAVEPGSELAVNSCRTKCERRVLQTLCEDCEELGSESRIHKRAFWFHINIYLNFVHDCFWITESCVKHC
jgi:hypothetical protein